MGINISATNGQAELPINQTLNQRKLMQMQREVQVIGQEGGPWESALSDR